MLITYERYKRLMDAVWYANGLRKQTAETGQDTVFMNYYGHIGGIYLTIIHGGWTDDKEEWERNRESWRLHSYTPEEVWDEAIRKVEEIYKEAVNDRTAD